jgi:L-asparaginase
MSSSSGAPRPRIAVFAGPTATILNSYPLTTSRKARAKHGLPGAGSPGFDVLRPQRLAKPVTVYIEQFSAHPLEADAAELHAPPDGYVGPDGSFSPQRRSPADKPVYEVELRPEDGLYPLPFMGRRSDGQPWTAAADLADARAAGDTDGQRRQTFYPDAERLFEEIDRFELGDGGANNLLSSRADFDFFRPAPSGGRPGERLGQDYFPYWPPDLRREPLSSTLARLTNVVQKTLASGDYAGGIWLEGSPFVEETSYWLNLLLDVPVPLVACAGNLGAGGADQRDRRRHVPDFRLLGRRRRP